MKNVLLELKNNKATIVNKETVYLDDNEAVQFQVQTKVSGRLFYTIDDYMLEIKGSKFKLNSNRIKDKIKITLKSEDSLPDFFILDLSPKNIRIIGDTLDKKYPEIIQGLQSEIDLLKEALAILYDEVAIIKKEGVIE